MKKRIAVLFLAAVMLAVFVSQAVAASAAAITVDVKAVYQAIDGNYQDSVGQRAAMSVTQNDADVEIWIHWGSSAFQTTAWNMHAVLTENNKLEYTDCRKFVINFDENGGEEWEQAAVAQDGYFTLADGKLLWNGAAEEACRACVFEMPPEEVLNKSYTGVYQRLWVEEIAGTYIEHCDFIVLNKDHTGCWVAQGVGTMTWNENQLMPDIGAAYEIARTQDELGEYLLVYEAQDADGVWTPTVFEKINELPEEIEEIIAEDALARHPELAYAGVYCSTQREEIGGTVVEWNSYMILNADQTGYWIAQDIGTVTWDNAGVTDHFGMTYGYAVTEENGITKLLVYTFQDSDGVWIPTVFVKIDQLPADVAARLAVR